MLIREADLAPAPGLNAITGETGAGKTILAQAIGLLLGAKGDAAYVGPGAEEAYVEAEFDLPAGLLEEEGLEALADLRPEDEDGLVLARRVFADGRTRAYAWGRSAAREDLAAAGERLLAMSGQFEQRRLARPSYQLDALDAFVGDEQRKLRGEARVAWREPGRRARAPMTRLPSGAASTEARLAELHALVEDTEGLEAGAEDRLREERERLRHVTELAEAAGNAAAALAPDEGEGAAGLAAVAERALGPVEQIAPELARARSELRDVEVRLRETALELRAFLESLEAEPDRLEQIEADLDRIAEAKRRFRCDSYEELLARAEDARAELAALDAGADPLQAAADALAAAEKRSASVADRLRKARRRRRARSRRRSPRTCKESAWGRASSRSSFASAIPGRPAPTRRSSAFARTAGFRSRRSRRRPPAGSSRASHSQSRPSAAGKRWSSTRSTQGSAARPRTRSASFCGNWASGPR